MTVYVDDMLKDAAVRNGDHTVRGRWSHLMADTTSELLDFAAGLGLHRSWLQKPGSPLEHFDITAGKRLRALELGAVQITYGEGGHLIRAKRAGVTFDLQLLRENPPQPTHREAIMADTQTTSARLAQPIRDARRMAQADGCPSCVANVEAPAWVDEPMTGTGYIAHYRCTDCGHEWTTSWEDET